MVVLNHVLVSLTSSSVLKCKKLKLEALVHSDSLARVSQSIAVFTHFNCLFAKENKMWPPQK